MKIVLIENQIDIILEALQSYIKQSDHKQLIYATYESLQTQKLKFSSDSKIVTTNTKNVINL